jgi:alpha-mannosidase
VEGIPLAGAALELVIFLPIGAAFYVNGQEMYREPSWADTRPVPLLLAERFEPGRPFTLAVRCNAGDGFGLFLSAVPRFSSLAAVAFELDTVRAQMAFTRYLAERARGQEARRFRRAWQAAAAQLNLDALAANHWDDWRASVEAARVELAPFAGEAKRHTAHLIAHSHIDMNWLWPMAETIAVCRRDFAAMEKLMAEFAEFRFSQSQAATYRAVESADPALFGRMKARIASGQWEVTANTWVENDLNMAGSEALVRQLLHGRRYVADRFGVQPLICWEPDTFGHPATLPQILAQSGIKFYYFCRAGRRHPLLWWEGLDGSRVLAVQDLRGYGGENLPSDVTGAVLDFGKATGLRRGLYVYGAGNHGGGATGRDILNAATINATPFLPQAQPSQATAFYEAALAELESSGSGASENARRTSLPVVRGELNTVFEGCYTSHGDIKQLNRDGENSLLTAEAVTAIAALQTGFVDPREELAEAWRTLCFHQFHDILCGCAIGVTYREARERLERVLATGRQATGQALAALAAAVDTTIADPSPQAPSDLRIVVFNPLAWERDDVVRVPLAALGGIAPAALADDAGQQFPVQVSGSDLIFVARGVPALGVRVYRPVAEKSGFSEKPGLLADPETHTLANGLLRLRVHPASGALDQLVDLRTGRDLAGPPGGWGPEAKVNAGMLNRLQIVWEQPHPMSAWNLGDTTRVDSLIAGAEVRVVEAGPVRGAIEVRRRFLNSALTQRIVLYRDLRRIDFETEVDWHERGSAHADAPLLRTTFTPFLGQTRATFEIAFAGLERPADSREVPALRWADLSERPGHALWDGAACGIALLNDGKYGHQAAGNTLGLTLVRASYEPDNNPDEGLHRFTYALYPHRRGWRDAGVERQAAQLNQPLLAVVTDRHAGALPSAQPGLACDSADVAVSAVKLAEDQPTWGRAVIVRLYEAHGRPAETILRPAWPVVRAEAVNPVEEFVAALPIAGGSLRLAFGPHEIKTVKLYSS